MEPEKKTNKMPTKTMLILRFVIAGYLLYLSYQLITLFLNPEMVKYALWEKILFIAFIILFITVGITVCVMTVIALIKGKYKSGKDE